MNDPVSTIAGLGVLAKGNAQAMAAVKGIWPALTEETGAEFARILRGLPLSQPNKFIQTQRQYYHRQTYAAAGQTSLQFFNVAPQDFICNLPVQGSVANDMPFALTSIAVTMEHLDTAGAKVPGAASSAAAATTSLSRFEEVLAALQGGELEFQINGRSLFRTRDLTMFPSGGGIDGFGATGVTAGAATHGNNGAPLYANQNVFRAPIVILPGQQIRVNCYWQQALALTTASAIRVTLIGEQLQQFQN